MGPRGGCGKEPAPLPTWGEMWLLGVGPRGSEELSLTLQSSREVPLEPVVPQKPQHHVPRQHQGRETNTGNNPFPEGKGARAEGRARRPAASRERVCTKSQCRNEGKPTWNITRSAS